MILGDYVTKIAVLDSDFEAQLEVAIMQQNYFIDGGSEIPFYLLTPRELARLRNGLDVENAFDRFADMHEDYCREVFGRRRVKA